MNILFILLTRLTAYLSLLSSLSLPFLLLPPPSFAALNIFGHSAQPSTGLRGPSPLVFFEKLETINRRAHYRTQRNERIRRHVCREAIIPFVGRQGANSRGIHVCFGFIFLLLQFNDRITNDTFFRRRCSNC